MLTVRGCMLHALRPDRLDAHEDAALVVDGRGSIVALHGQDTPGHAAALSAAAADGSLLTLEPGQVLLPGLVDLHVHAPQWPQMGRALHLPLQDWLRDCTFPLERRYADLAFARSVYAEVVDGLLAQGTTTAVYFATLHDAASLALAEICLERGQRACVGRVAMDHPEQCPADYRDASAADAIEGTRHFIDAVRALPGNADELVRPMVTPRFIPACTDAVLAGLGRLARERDCAVQTHCSESAWEHGFVQARTGRSDTASLDGFGLLRPGSILAHGNFIEDADIGRIVARGAAIAHCPISNAFFADRIFPLRRFLQRGVHVGLGTDISGGYSPSVLENARQAMIVSRLLETDGAQAARIDYQEAFWLATAGGGEALGLPIGQFLPGYQFDAILVEAPRAPLEDRLQRIICTATRADIATVWVAGRRVL